MCKIYFCCQIEYHFSRKRRKNVWFFDYHLLTRSVRKMVLICLMQTIDKCLLYSSHQITRLVSNLINHFSKWRLPCNKKMLLNLVEKNKFYTSVYIIKWQLKQNIATRVSSRKKCYYFWWSTWLLSPRASVGHNQNILTWYWISVNCYRLCRSCSLQRGLKQWYAYCRTYI